MEPRRRFRIIKELSEGAFGKVYLAEMITGENFKSVVAIKLLHGKWAGHEEIVQRSRDEARVLGLLHHRNIIRVEDLTSINGQCAVVMEYLNGVDMKTLSTFVRERGQQIPRKVVLEICSQIASALDAAFTHEPLQGGEPLELIHRDIKPSNVMLTCSGEVKVLDFGTAQARFDHREAHTQALAFGSAAYMAPERILGDKDQPWGDIFSLGITTYEMLSLKSFGKIQVRPERAAEQLATCLGELDLEDLGPEIGGRLKAFLSRMLSYEPEDRPTAVEIVTFMEDAADQIHDGTVRRFCREVVTPCRELVEPVQDPNDPLAGSTLFEDTTTINSVVVGDYMDETEDDDSQASSLRGIDKGHVENEAGEGESGASPQAGGGDTEVAQGSSIHPLAVPEPRRAEARVGGATWIPDEDERGDLLASDPALAETVDPDSTGPVPESSHTPLPVDAEATPRISGIGTSPLNLVEAETEDPEPVGEEESEPVSDAPPADEDSQVAEAGSPAALTPVAGTDGTSTVVLESVLDAAAEDEELEPVARSGSRTWLLGLIALGLMGGGVGLAYHNGLFGKTSPEKRTQKDDDEDKDKDKDEGSSDDDEGSATDEGMLQPLVEGEAYSLGLSEEGAGGSLRLSIEGEVEYVVFPQLGGRFWDGQGQLELSETTLAEQVSIKIGIGGTQKPVRLDAQDEGVICYRYVVDTEQEEVVECE